MVTSKFKTAQYTAEQFVESAGAILFHVQKRQICLLHHIQWDEWLLAKGRRNVGESRLRTALRETTEETGFECEIMPMNMTTRAPPAVEILQNYPDEPRCRENVVEPFMTTLRYLDGKNNIKIIWWYMAAICGSIDNEHVAQGEGEEDFEARLFDFDEALEKIRYDTDRDVIKEAIRIFKANETNERPPDAHVAARTESV